MKPTMKQAKEITSSLIKQAQKMRLFKIKVRVEDNWLPMGRVPFNIKIKNNIATVEVIAESISDAKHQVEAYFETDDWIE